MHAFQRRTAGRWGLGILLTTALALGLVSLIGCPPQDGQSNDDPNVVDVRMQAIAFDPKEVTIRKGQSVRWTNFDVVAHTTTSGNPGELTTGALWDSGFVSTGQSFLFTFVQEGEFVYHCRVHPFVMRDAKVIVTP